MLGPEQVNLTARSSPILLAGLVAVKISEQMARQLGLRDNQVVRGVIESRGDLLKLVLNNREINWPGSRRLRPGDKIDFRVVATDQGSTLLPIKLPDDPATPNMPFSERFLQLLYRPRQASTLMHLLTPKSLAMLLSQTNFAEADKRIGPLLPSMASLAPTGVKRALANSGLFTENHLARRLPIKQDTKVFLRTLLRLTAQQNQPQLVADIQSAIDQLESRQLDSLQAQSNRELSYSFTLLFRDADPVEVEFSQTASTNPETEREWIIDLHTNSKALGPLWLKTTVHSAGIVDMLVWIERDRSAQLARDAMAELAAELEAFGLNLREFEVFNSPRPLPDQQLNRPGDMVDICT